MQNSLDISEEISNNVLTENVLIIQNNSTKDTQKNIQHPNQLNLNATCQQKQCLSLQFCLYIVHVHSFSVPFFFIGLFFLMGIFPMKVITIGDFCTFLPQDNVLDMFDKWKKKINNHWCTWRQLIYNSRQTRGKTGRGKSINMASTWWGEFSLDIMTSFSMITHCESYLSTVHQFTRHISWVTSSYFGTQKQNNFAHNLIM